MPTGGSSSVKTAIIGGAVVGFLILTLILAIIVVVIIAVVFKIRKKRKCYYDLPNQNINNTSVPIRYYRRSLSFGRLTLLAIDLYKI